MLRSVTTTTFELRQSAFSARIVSACMLKTFNRMSKEIRIYIAIKQVEIDSRQSQKLKHMMLSVSYKWGLFKITRTVRTRPVSYTFFILLSQINFFYDNPKLNLGLNPAEMGLSHLSVPTSSPPGRELNQGCGSGSRCFGLIRFFLAVISRSNLYTRLRTYQKLSNVVKTVPIFSYIL